jgi:uncharacterized Zn finger protein
MCKHVAAVLYGVGARFDASPELLFRLRQVDESAVVSLTSMAHRSPSMSTIRSIS